MVKTSLKPYNPPFALTFLIDGCFLFILFFLTYSETWTFKTLPLTPIKTNIPLQNVTADLLLAIDNEEIIYLGNQKELFGAENVVKAIQNRIAANQLPPSPKILIKADRTLPCSTLVEITSRLSLVSESIYLITQ